MIKYLQILPETLVVIIVCFGFLSMLALVWAVIYRLVKYGIKIKAGNIEIDASEDKAEINQKP